MLTHAIHDEISQGQGLYLSEACGLLPRYRRGAKVTIGCLVRWITSGVKGHDGITVKLEAARLANRWITTRSAIARFLAAQSPNIENRPIKPSSPAKRQRAADRAARDLEKLGI